MELKIQRIERDIKNIVAKAYSREPIHIYRYGAYDIDPNYLMIWICVDTDKVKDKLSSDIKLTADIIQVFDTHNYPQLQDIRSNFDFESEETVDRESDGDWYLHFK